MSGDAKTPPPAAGDPSMEDILASIRRILSEDEPPPAEPGAEPSPAAPPPGQPVDDVLVLDPSMMVPDPQHAAPLERAHPEPHDEQPQHTAPVEQPMSQDAPAEPPYAPPAPAFSGHEGGLVAPAAAAAAATSVGSLVRALTERSAQVHTGGPTIEDLVRDEIRPILAQWLDMHLPPIVERLVRVEIERVVGRAVP